MRASFTDYYELITDNFITSGISTYCVIIVQPQFAYGLRLPIGINTIDLTGQYLFATFCRIPVVHPFPRLWRTNLPWSGEVPERSGGEVVVLW